MKYQLIIQFPVTEDFDFDGIIALETRLTLEMGEGYVIDGHEFGAGEINIFIQTDDPEAGYEKAFELVSTSLISLLRVVYRVKNTDEFVWLYPANNQDEFSIK
mgnify:FL=1|jgi:hypothetical protein|tara:strand:+ start:31 stop:339 length:309 start_codon:yes stop_codon:yes gene_type:complete